MLWDKIKEVKSAGNQTKVIWLELPVLHHQIIHHADDHHYEWHILSGYHVCNWGIHAVQDCEVFALCSTDHETRKTTMFADGQWRKTQLSKGMQNSSAGYAYLLSPVC